jgi:outer membrane receptor protein involved in Fe transport
VKIPSLIFLLLYFAIQGLAQTSNRLTGFVFDQNGSPIQHATVRFIEGSEIGPERSTSTDDAGLFLFENVSDHRGRLIVEAPGFRRSSIVLSDADVEMQVVLLPVAVTGMVTITRTESRIEETAASVVALGRKELDVTAATTLDDRLRQVPGFSLFRRAGSRSANPTTQGVSLRGVGASGASRALVLADGIPLNDPFGGWVYWGRVPSESISQVEVLRGPSADLYGSSAIGGTVSISTMQPRSEPFASFETSYGTQQTPLVSGFASGGIADWNGSLAGEFFQTNGFIPVEESMRGSVDTEANVSRWVVAPFVERSFGGTRRAFVRADLFHESRENGTPLQTNETDLWTLAGGFDWDLSPRDSISFRLNGGKQDYDQTFSAVAADRNSEALNRFQHVPSNYAATSAQWTGTHRQAVMFAGFDIRRVEGHSDETGIVAGTPTSKTDAGGSEITGGLFAGIIMPVGSRLTLSGGFRGDWWKNSDGFSRTTSLVTGVMTALDFPDRSASAFSPRLSALYRATKNVSVAATYSEGFRRPTLNELYRNFRVGDILTLANSNLNAERARGFDAAVIVTGFDRKFYVRSGMFCTFISGNVSNVTLNIAPTLITRQRQNIGETRACGLEADWNFIITKEMTLSGGYLFVDSRVTEFPANPVVEGLLVPQVAPHQFGSQFKYTRAKIGTFALQVRANSSQYDDDLNQFKLAAFATADVFYSRRITSKVEIFGAVENLFDAEIESGRTPVLTLASPRTARLGMRFRFGRR